MHYYQYCPHCGTKSFSFHGAEHFSCSACGHELFLNSAAAVVAIIRNDRGEIMLAERARDPWKGTLDLPGGFVDPGESFEMAMKREIMEELNRNLLSMRYLTSTFNTYPYSGRDVYTTDAVFECQLDSTDDITPCDDVASIHWMRPEDVDVSDIPSASMRRIIAFLAKK